jgi:ribosomal protein L11 methyltransferase
MIENWIITTKIENDIERENAIALFFDLGAEGVEENEQEIKVYFPNEIINRPNFSTNISNICGDFTIDELPKTNWNETWESNFKPIFVDGTVQIRASFHPIEPNFKYNIIIDPKMSFGTGHHATTYQMIKAMSLLNFEGKQVFDCGSGTGILAILAEKMGASHVLALDNDKWCFENCTENIVLNNCIVTVPMIGEINQVDDLYDIILANINRNFLLQHLGTLAQKLKPNAYLIISGFFESEMKMLLDEALEQELIANNHFCKDNWACILLQKIK